MQQGCTPADDKVHKAHPSLVQLGRGAASEQHFITLYSYRLQFPGLAGGVGVSHELFVLISGAGECGRLVPAAVSQQATAPAGTPPLPWIGALSSGMRADGSLPKR